MNHYVTVKSKSTRLTQALSKPNQHSAIATRETTLCTSLLLQPRVASPAHQSDSPSSTFFFSSCVPPVGFFGAESFKLLLFLPSLLCARLRARKLSSPFSYPRTGERSV